VLNNLARPNADRAQVTVTLPGSGVAIPALTAMREWVRNQVRTPNGPSSRRSLRGGDPAADVEAGRRLFIDQGCASCHGGQLWTSSVKDFVSPPAATDVFTETNPAPAPPAAPIGVSYINRFLRDIGSFNLGVAGGNNPIGDNVGGIEKASAALNAAGVAGAAPDGLGFDFNGDGRGTGFSPPSLLGINAVPPYYHNGACETLECVVSNVRHRTANNTRPDLLTSERAREQLVAFLRTIAAGTPAP
jgi:cytochrome c peroxidase